MISFIRGSVLQIASNYLILETGNLGYKIFTTPEVLRTKQGESLELYTYHKSGDDGQALFGLPDFQSLEFFELLISVSGIGPKAALSILSSGQIDMISQAIVHQDAEIFTRISGIGKKTAERIIVDLKNKVGSIAGPTGSSEVYDALIGLGYSAKEIRDTLPKLDGASPTDKQLKEALRMLGR
jgi:Holliday junction DNA helicase RuvA